MTKFKIYPISKSGKIVKGFCPTIVEDENDAHLEACRLMADLIKYKIKFHSIKVETL